jgi:DNA-damage-inducible protein J
MAQTVNVNFRMDEQLKKNVEEICQRMGMNLTTALTICCRKIEQERRIPFDVTADPDPFYQESNVRELKRRLDAIKDGTAVLEEHDLIEVE